MVGFSLRLKVRCHEQTRGIVKEFLMLDALVLQELRDKYNDLTARVAELRRFL